MSWPIGAVAAVAMAVLVLGCTKPPARQGVGVSRTPAKAAAQITSSRRVKAQPASASVAPATDPNRWQDIEIPPSSAPVSTRRQAPSAPLAVRSSADQAGVGLTAGIGVSSVRFAPPRARVRPAGVLSITEINLDSTAPVRNAADPPAQR